MQADPSNSNDTQHSVCYDIKGEQFMKETKDNSNNDSIGVVKWAIQPSQLSNSIGFKTSASQDTSDTGEHTPRDRIITTKNSIINDISDEKLYDMIKSNPELAKKFINEHIDLVITPSSSPMKKKQKSDD